MKLNKTKWSPTIIGEIAMEIKDKLQSLKGYEEEKFIRPEDLLIGDFFVKSFRSTIGIKSGKKCKVGDILFARRSVSISQFKKRSCILTFDGICSDELTVIREKPQFVEQGFLNLVLNTSRLWDYGISKSGGSVSKRIKWKDLQKYQFNLPPKDDQKKIIDLLFSLENLIIQTEDQEKNIKNLRQKLIDDLIEESSFGNIIEEERLRSVNFGEIVSNNTKAVKNPLEKGIKYAVGLGNITPDNLVVNSLIDIEQEGTNFARYFTKGQLLFGARRAYLRQMVIAPVEGVCTANIMVFDTIDKTELIREYLYLIVQSNSFINYATSTSVGSLFPNAKWDSLKNFKLKIPDIKTQNLIVDTFEECNKLIKEIENQLVCLKKLKFSLLDKIFD